MTTLRLKPLSLNSAYRGRRFTTPELKQFKKDVSRLLPRMEIPNSKLSVSYKFGVSSKNSDGDNLIKCFQDALADCYGFNDKKIYKWQVEKVDVKKGSEYISFKIESI
jgi:Holliday junction resolvase RusA-like endonuclease